MADYVGSKRSPVNAKAEVEAVGCTGILLTVIAFALIWVVVHLWRIADALQASNEAGKEAPIAQRHAE